MVELAHAENCHYGCCLSLCLCS